MEYLMDVHFNYEPHIDDLYLSTPTLPPMRLMFGEPIVLTPEEEGRWARFLKFIEEKGYKPLESNLIDERRWGYLIYYLFYFNLPADKRE